MEHKKKFLSTEEQIQHLKEKGVTFSLVSEKDAAEYLKFNNNYFKLASYRKNYEKYHGGKKDGQYIALDFGYLEDLAIIDMHLRYALVQLSLDIEHYSKMEILRKIEDHQEDGYQICTDFINAMDLAQRRLFDNEISRFKGSIYCGDIYNKYHNDLPVWVLLEIIPFGRMVSFYGFCAKRYNDRKMKSRYYMLRTCKDVRNASAHSSCILNDLHIDTADTFPDSSIVSNLCLIPELSRPQVKNRLSNARIQQIVTLLYMHSQVVTSNGVRDKAGALLNGLKERIARNIGYYESNDLIRETFKFLFAVIDNWYTHG